MLRKILFLGIVCVAVLWLLNVFATPTTEPTWTVRLPHARGLQVGDAVEEGTQRIGRVVAVTTPAPGADASKVEVRVTLAPRVRERLREHTTAFVATPPGADRPVLQLVVFEESGPVLPPGSVISGVNSEIEAELKRQLLAASGVIRDLSRQLEGWGQTLDRTLQSEEMKKLEDSAGGLVDTLRRTQDELTRAVTREIERLKKLYEKIFPREHETV
ncbi:MAG: hypothetical protein HYZ50_14235 [Deltaproteobacteria bacterium]|nr:hypothetical protein [Deltaproteobacteria bacterium]